MSAAPRDPNDVIAENRALRQRIIELEAEQLEALAREEVLRASEQKLRRLVENTHDIIYTLTADGKFLFVSAAWTRLLGHSPADAEGRPFTEFVHPDDHAVCFEFLQKILKTAEPQQDVEYRVRHANGTWRWHTSNASPIRDASGAVTCYDGVARDITEHKHAEKALRESESQLRTITDAMHDAIVMLNPMGVVVFWNPAAESILGYSPEEAIGMNAHELLAPKESIDAQRAAFPEFAGPRRGKFELTARRKDAREITISLSLSAVLLDGEWHAIGIIRDITEHNRAEAEKEKLQAQLIQAQKMESVGRLAGGVAHDFNNMLSVILGHTQMAMDQLDPTQPLYADLQEVHKAAERSADLTRQLLAFARKQTIAPIVIDVNETVTGMLRMLRRLIGEDITLTWLPGPNTGSVRIDPSQIDQILANLCVNARDAIAGTGRLTIETANATFDDDYCAQHAGFSPGEYALLAVSDTGCGMDAATMSHLFEPFFTTKQIGQGTGLGLATVFGIVRQNNGFINVYSEPGQGTTFKIYLPSNRTGSAASEPVSKPPPRESTGETVLLVEDESAIRQVTTRMLQRLGYAVVAAGTPGEAICLAREHTGQIDVLLTDIVMPEMNGRDLAKNLLLLCPHLKCLFMSGYTANVIAHQGVLDEGVHFLQKPFSSRVLAAKLCEVLGNKP